MEHCVIADAVSASYVRCTEDEFLSIIYQMLFNSGSWRLTLYITVAHMTFDMQDSAALWGYIEICTALSYKVGL